VWDGSEWVPGNPTSSLVIGFVIADGTSGTDIGPMLVAARSGSVSKCKVVVKASDASTDLGFTIKQNGISVFTSSPTVTAGTASGTVLTFTGLTASPPPLAISADDVFTIDIISGSSSWVFTAQLET